MGNLPLRRRQLAVGQEQCGATSWTDYNFMDWWVILTDELFIKGVRLYHCYRCWLIVFFPVSATWKLVGFICIGGCLLISLWLWLSYNFFSTRRDLHWTINTHACVMLQMIYWFVVIKVVVCWLLLKLVTTFIITKTAKESHKYIWGWHWG